MKCKGPKMYIYVCFPNTNYNLLYKCVKMVIKCYLNPTVLKKAAICSQISACMVFNHMVNR